MNIELQSEPEVEILQDSISEWGKRIVTFRLKYWRAIHSEMMTHRVFSRNASSSRARPIAKNIELIQKNPYGPMEWGMNQPGMVAEKQIDDQQKAAAKMLWVTAAKSAAMCANALDNMKVHKQIANRLLEPFMPIEVVLTSTEWSNFFKLRLAKDAQPEIQQLAQMMKKAMDESEPKKLKNNDWHLPFIKEEEKKDLEEFYKTITNSYDQQSLNRFFAKISAARCARISYKCFDGTVNYQKDWDLAQRLKNDGHLSPFEHQATPLEPAFFEPDTNKCILPQSGNFVGWQQHRKLVEHE